MTKTMMLWIVILKPIENLTKDYVVENSKEKFAIEITRTYVHKGRIFVEANNIEEARVAALDMVGYCDLAPKYFLEGEDTVDGLTEAEADEELSKSQQYEKIKDILREKVDFESNLDQEGLIDCFYYDKDQDYTLIGRNDSNDGALDEVVYKALHDHRFDLERFFKNQGEGESIFGDLLPGDEQEDVPKRSL